MSEAMLARLHAVLKSNFALDDVATARLIDAAAVADRGAIDLYHFTRQLNDALDDEGRRRVIRMMWEIVLVDRTASEFASNIVWRAADLLAVPPRERIALRQRIAAESAVAAGPSSRRPGPDFATQAATFPSGAILQTREQP